MSTPANEEHHATKATPRTARFRRLRAVALLAIGLAVGRPSAAQAGLPPDVAAVDLPQAAQLVEDAGLTGTFAMHVAVDDRGVAWLATAVGLVRYDGYSWERFTVRDGLPSDFVRCVTIARDGTLWVGTDRGVARRVDGSFRILEPPSPFPNVRRIVEDHDGALWICADTWRQSGVASGLARWHDGTWTAWGDELPDRYVSDVVRTADDRFFMLTRGGLYERVGTTWQRPLAGLVDADEDSYAWKLVETRDGLAAMTYDAIYLSDGSTWRRFPLEAGVGRGAKSLFVVDGVPHAADSSPAVRIRRWTGARFEPVATGPASRGWVEHVEVAPDGSLWFVGYDTLVRWRHDSEWQKVALPAPTGLDAAGSLWFVGDDGARVRTADGWRAVPEIRGPAAFGADGLVWSWSDSEIVSVDPDRAFEARRYEPGGPVRDVFPTPDGGAWALSYDASSACRVARLEDGAWRWGPAAPWSASARPNGGSVAPNGDLLLVLREPQYGSIEVFRAGPLAIRSLGAPPADTAEGGRVAVIDGSVWAWGPFGVWRRDGEAWREIRGNGRRLASLVEERGREIWIVSAGTWGGRDGLWFLRDGAWVDVDDRVRSRGGRGSDGSLYFIDRDNAIASVPPQTVQLSRLRFPPMSAIRSVWGDAHGDLWVDAPSGVYRYRPDGVAPATFLAASELQVTEGQSIFPRAHAVERYRARADGAFEYSWRIDEEPWSPYVAIADDLQLPVTAGRHRLSIRARDEGMDVDPAPAVASIDVLPVPLQSRAWFLPAVLVTTLAIALLAATLAFSRYQLRRHARGLERTVAARTRDLRETTALLQTTFDHIPFDVWACDVEGRCVRQNLGSRRRWGALDGRTPAESGPAVAAGSDWSDRHRRALAGEIVTQDVRYVIDEEPVDCISVVAPIQDGDSIIGLVGIDVDVTEQRRAEKELRDSKQRFRRLAEASPSIIVQFDADGRPTYVNHRWAAMSGRPRDDAFPDGWWDSIDPADRAEAHGSLLEAIRTRTEWHQEFRVRHVAGRTSWLLANGVPIDGADRPGVIGVCVDITDRHELDERRRRLSRELDHRVKNNLAWVLSLIMLTRESSASIDEFTQALSRRVHAMARAHEGLAAAKWRDMTIARLVGDAFAGVETDERISAGGPEIRLDASSAGPLALCLHELATNAVKHGALARPGGRVAIEWRWAAPRRVRVVWEEHVAAPIALPVTEGAGLGLLRGLVERDLRGTLDLRIERDGVRCGMELRCVAPAELSGVAPLAGAESS